MSVKGDNNKHISSAQGSSNQTQAAEGEKKTANLNHSKQTDAKASER